MWRYNYSPYLQHYASEYYDPEKAHEYYEKHKHLKGRSKSQASLNEEGKSVANSVKETINEERDIELNEEEQRHKQEMLLLSDASKRTMEQHRKIMNQRITSIQNLIKRMPKNAKASQVPKLKALIKKLYDDNDKKRKSLQEKYSNERYEASSKSQEAKKQIRETAKNTYEQELSKIRSESRYIKAKKSE